MTEAMREQFEATAWRVTADAAIHDCLNDDERDVIYFDKRDVPTGEEAEGFTVTPLYTYQAALRSPAVAGLVEAAKAVAPYVASEVLEHCNGNKCREPWCAGCMGEEHAEASVEKARDASSKLFAALAQYATLAGESR
jgi:hypothetical protein